MKIRLKEILFQFGGHLGSAPFFLNYARYARADGPTEETRNDGFPEIYQGL
jgi:hypothetical protein